jgi:hypothetical protein
MLITTLTLLYRPGHSNKDHCNAHGGRSLYRDMRSAARRPVASASHPSPAVKAAGPSRRPIGPSSGQKALSKSAARPSGIPAAAVSNTSPGSKPAAWPPAPSRAAQPPAGMGESTVVHSRVACASRPFFTHPTVLNRLHCNLVRPPAIVI